MSQIETSFEFSSDSLMRSMGNSIQNNIGDYSISEKLSRGGEGFVFKIIQRKKKNQYALKVIDKSLDTDEKNKAKIISKIENQIKIHRDVSDCPYIITLRTVFEDQDNSYMVLEYCPQGDLTKYVMNNTLTIQEIRQFARHICEGIKYLHQNGIVHRDIKPSNILISKDKIAKICDFGLSMIGDNFKDIAGTLKYMSRQMLLSQKYGKQVDMWALGCTLYFMATGQHLFNFQKISEATAYFVSNKLNITFPQYFDEDLKTLIVSLLTQDPQVRLTSSNVLKSQFFSNRRKSNLSPLKMANIKPSILQTSDGIIKIDKTSFVKFSCCSHRFDFKIDNTSTITITKSKNSSKSYSTSQLPQKYHPLYKYCKDVVKILQQTQPVTCYENKSGRFEILKNGNFIAKFQNGKVLELKDILTDKQNISTENTIAKQYYQMLKKML